MKITIQLSLDHHERLMKYASEESPAYHTLKNGVIVDSEEARVVVIVCDADQAELIRDSAKHFCPEAVSRIEKSISLARFTVP